MRRLLLALVWFPLACQAQLTLSLSDTTALSCDDYATLMLNDPWDMSSNADVNNFFPDVDLAGFTNPTISGGLFSGVTSGSGARTYMISPTACGSYPTGGRYGENYPLDTTKYKSLSIRMYTDKRDTIGIRLLWDRGCGAGGATRSETAAAAIPTEVGWHTYTVDLTAVGLNTGTSTNLSPWSSGSVVGLAVLPTAQSGAQVDIDWIRLEDPTTCTISSVPVTINATTSGSNNLYSLYLVDASHTNPFSTGYARKLVSAATPSGSTSIGLTSVLGLEPGAYKVVGVLDSDFATLVRDNPWDFSDDGDVVANSVPNYSLASGVVTGTGPGNVYLNIGAGIDPTKYSKLTIGGSFPGNDLRVYFSDGSGGGVAAVQAGDIVGGVFQKNMAAVTGWTSGGTKTTLIIQPQQGPFTLDFVSLRGTGFDTARSASTVAASLVTGTGTFTVNSPPTVEFQSPNPHGGVAVAPWNMNTDDFVLFGGLSVASDSLHSGEKLTSYLPDVRTVDGLRGDFFKGTNTEGNGDPVNYSTLTGYPQTPTTFSADQYRNLCFKLFIDRTFDLGLGSVARVLWKQPSGNFQTGEDLVLIYDGWSGTKWYEYCMDMKSLLLDDSSQTAWDGTIDTFRVDSHEFPTQTSYYFDYIKLRKDSLAPGHFLIGYDAYDADNDTLSVSLYYGTSATSRAGETLINTQSVSNRYQVYEWDATGVPDGTYYLHAVVSDGINPAVVRFSPARVVVDNTATVGTAPVLNVAAPQDNDTVCTSTLQVKGYALHTDRYEEVPFVDVAVDGTTVGRVLPRSYSVQAVTDHPSNDSSNTGFDTTITAPLSTGSHTMTLTAYGSDGTSSMVSRTIVKGNSGCAAQVVDPTPAGVPIVPSQINTPTPTPTPRPTYNDAKVSKATHSRSNPNVRVVVSGIKAGNAGCSLSLLAGDKASNVTSQTLLKTNLSSQDISRGSVTFTLAKLPVSTRGPKQFYIASQLRCDGVTYSLSTLTRMTFVRAKTGERTAARILKLLKQLKKKA